MKIISPARSENYDISNELEIELSVIESGLVVAKVESSIAFIIKDSGKMVERLSGLRSALLNFKRISRPEFPTINVELRLKTVCGLSVKYGYFFNSDSEHELNILQSIIDRPHTGLYFLTDTYRRCIRMEVEELEIDQLRNCLKNL